VKRTVAAASVVVLSVALSTSIVGSPAPGVVVDSVGASSAATLR
jgi:hypothetical protein